MDIKREYKITKISDQKEVFYQFFRNLSLGDDGFPVKDELINLRNLEKNIKTSELKHVAFLMGEEDITILSFLKESAFKKRFLKEYKENWLDIETKKIEFFTNREVLSSLASVVSDLDKRVRDYEVPEYVRDEEQNRRM